MARIGLVGLSSPTFYDYSVQGERTSAELQSSPNPIIEGAFGAMLLYDELWFITRALCPFNMRNLPYVKFLDEVGEVPEIDPEYLPDGDDYFDAENLNSFSESIHSYHEIKQQARMFWNVRDDNHTHGIQVGKNVLRGSSGSVKSVIHDLLFVERLPERVELITNSFTSKLFKQQVSINSQLCLTESLILDNVPQFLSQNGPYHQSIEDVRESNFLTSFRKWIAADAFSAGKIEINEVKKEVEAKLIEAQNQIFLNYLDPSTTYTTMAETLLGVLLDELLPGVSTVKGLAELAKDNKAKDGIRWQGFIIDARSRVGR